MLAARIGVHPPIGTSTDDQVLQKSLPGTYLAVLRDGSVSASRQLELALLFTVADQAFETVALGASACSSLRVRSAERTRNRAAP